MATIKEDFKPAELSQIATALKLYRMSLLRQRDKYPRESAVYTAVTKDVETVDQLLVRFA